MICLECGTTTDKEICERDGCPTVDGQEFGQNGDPLVGALFTEKYRCISLLGRGGMGRVYKAWQRDLNRVVALKVISDEISSNEAAVRRFMREVRVTSQLNHPNSIRIFDFGYTEGRRIFFSMEFLVGRSLFRAIQAREQFDDLRVIHVASQVLKSLGEAHRKGIIHRDLTPDNIFLVPVTGDRDFVKVLDFGVAKAKGGWATGSGLTAEGYLIGKPKYVSPEQIEHEEEIDGRSDLYSLGIVMYEMICGAAPFVSATPLKTVLQHVNEPPPDIREKARRPVGRELAGFVMRLLEKDREKRPASAETALNLLQEIEKEMSGAPGREADKTRFHPGK
ncbi:MAG: serine/threonine protein kinase, partial [Deltaproteobacteria bacterium]|nr:serine/threonine protein kinase [Deltaproteobacteria bacterium]